MNKIQEYFWFIKPDRQFLEKAYALHDLSNRLNSLNERRKVLQREYKQLKQSSNCTDCKGKCCTDKYAPYYSVIDCLLRMFSDDPVTEIFWWKPRRLGVVALKNIRSIGKEPASVEAAGERGWCPALTADGCGLAAEARPMRCILYICPEARQSLPADILRKMGAINMELEDISNRALNSFRRRSRFLI